jgi:hypothetical protein
MDMAIPPQAEETIQGSCTVPDSAGEIRVVDLFGHVHAHGVRVSAWTASSAPPNDSRTLIYESFNWAELDLVRYDSVTQNPAPDPAIAQGGGYSGNVILQPGDRLDYECEIHNTSDITLHYAARTYRAEMCSMFGTFLATDGRSEWRCVTR